MEPIVEQYSLPVFGEDLQEIGFENVKCVTSVTTDGNIEKTIQHKIRDIYDNHGTHIKTLVKSLEFTNNFDTIQAEEKVIEKEVSSPILEIKNKKIEDSIGPQVNLYGLSTQALLDNVSSKLSAVEAKSVPGFARPEKIEKSDVTALIGAYDNYATIFSTTFGFQTLSATAGRYVKIEGKLSDGSNQPNFGEAQNYISSYQEYMIRRLETPSYNEVLDWYDRIVTFASLVAGFATGPAGWVSICLNFAGAFSLFRNLTSYVYATEQRKDYSKLAMQWLERAREMQYYKNWTNCTSTLVKGYGY